MKRIAIITAAMLIVGIAALVARVLIAGGMFAELKPGFAGTCAALPGVVGAEDIQIDRLDGLVFVSATDRRAAGRRALQDGIYVLQLAHPEAGFAKLSGVPATFHPHGISLYRAADGALTLMVVNHLTQAQSAVDIFEVVNETGHAALNEIGDIQSDKLLHPNDVLAVGKEQFYVTNDHGSRTPLGMTLENYLLLPRANVLYFDGAVFKLAVDGLVFANGINISPDGRHVYVAESTGREVRSFARDAFSGRLTPEHTLALDSGPDNIDVDAKGDLWVASHPKLFALIDYAGDPSKPSPSQVFKLTVKDGVPQSAAQVYANLGRPLGAASVGAVADGHLFVGSIFDPRILDCRLP